MDTNKKTKTVSVILPMETVEELEKIVKKEDRNMSWAIRKAIQEFLEKNKE